MKKMLTCTLLQALAIAPVGLAEEKSATEKIGEKVEDMTPEVFKSETAKKEAAPIPAHLKVESLSFASGVTQLTEDEKAKLKAFVENAMTSGTIKDIKVAAWSDNEVPTDPLKSLSKEDQKLAEDRAEHVKKYMRDQLKMKKVEIYNMAHGTSRLAKAFRTEESELRTAFSDKAATTKLRPEVIAIRDYGKASSVVIVVELKEHKAK